MAKHLISIDNLSKKTIEDIFNLADSFDKQLNKGHQNDLCKGKIMATMFYEPSTRTRMSFESAMYRLGGSVISSADTVTTSSAAKGESLADTIKVLQHYADLIVLRHFKDGSTLLAAENSDVPIISGGDGSYEHPTQTLCDLYTLRREKGEIKNLQIAVCGDLKYGRTVHSLVYGLAKFGATIFSVAQKDFDFPENVKKRLKSKYGVVIKNFTKLDEKMNSEDVLYMTNIMQSKKSKSAKKILKESDELFPRIPIEYFDAVYITRLQMERMQGIKSNYKSLMSYLVNKELLEKAKKDTIVMHPLPRRYELSYDVDHDKRAAYFRQAAYGIPIRMAIIAMFLGLVDFDIKLEPHQQKGIIMNEQCVNTNCITAGEENVQNKFLKSDDEENMYRCFYCDYEKVIRV